MRILLLLALALLGCGVEHEPTLVAVSIHTESDPGVPLAGVTVSAAGASLGTSDASGVLTASLSGDPGASVALRATCPDGYRSGRVDASVVLRPVFDVTGAERPLDVTLDCPPSARSGVVVVRAGGDAPRAGLPVLLDGREVATTDASGVAHVAVRMAPGEQFHVELVTAAIAPTLRPSNPVTQFSFGNQDEIFALDQSFEDARLPPPTHVPVHHPQPPATSTTTRPVELHSAGSYR